MPEARMPTTTSPGPGTGSAKSWRPTWRLPRNTSPRIALRWATRGLSVERRGLGRHVLEARRVHCGAWPLVERRVRRGALRLVKPPPPRPPPPIFGGGGVNRRGNTHRSGHLLRISRLVTPSAGFFRQSRTGNHTCSCDFSCVATQDWQTCPLLWGRGVGVDPRSGRGVPIRGAKRRGEGGKHGGCANRP